jgi:hypothetical protein
MNARVTVSRLLRPTLLLVDLQLYVVVNSENDQVRNDVGCSDSQEYSWIFKWDLFRHLHHHKDDHQVGTVSFDVSICMSFELPCDSFVHLRADRHLELFLARLGMMKEKIWWWCRRGRR